jgi:hypothetical protein
MVHTISYNSSPGLSFADAGCQVDASLKADVTTADAAMAAGNTLRVLAGIADKISFVTWGMEIT